MSMLDTNYLHLSLLIHFSTTLSIFHCYRVCVFFPVGLFEIKV